MNSDNQRRLNEARDEIEVEGPESNRDDHIMGHKNVNQDQVIGENEPGQRAGMLIWFSTAG